ncbi:hypothetical protein ACOMHN_041284 [Nucella lapillus]
MFFRPGLLPQRGRQPVWLGARRDRLRQVTALQAVDLSVVSPPASPPEGCCTAALNVIPTPARSRVSAGLNVNHVYTLHVPSKLALAQREGVRKSVLRTRPR